MVSRDADAHTHGKPNIIKWYWRAHHFHNFESVFRRIRSAGVYYWNFVRLTHSRCYKNFRLELEYAEYW